MLEVQELPDELLRISGLDFVKRLRGDGGPSGAKHIGGANDRGGSIGSELFFESCDLLLLLAPFRAVLAFRAHVWLGQELLDGHDGDGFGGSDGLVLARKATAAGG